MHVLMNIQNALLTEFLIAYFTGIMALTTMLALMRYQITRHCMPNYTHQKHKGAHHYAIVDVLSDCFVD
jgi:hypothetical protein